MSRWIGLFFYTECTSSSLGIKTIYIMKYGNCTRRRSKLLEHALVSLTHSNAPSSHHSGAETGLHLATAPPGNRTA